MSNRGVCHIGGHTIAPQENEYRCAFCGYAFCTAHWGNTDAKIGDQMACIEHVEEVRQIEARLAAMRASKHQSGTSENILVGLEQLRQIVGEEVRKALHEDESDWQAQIVTLPTPANAISVEWNIGGKRYKGILFEQKEEETTA